jgi:biopolymer transport protein ExbD
VVKIDVELDGTVLWDGQIVPDRTMLASKFQSLAAMPEQAEVHVHPNKLAEYKAVAAVLASAQRSGVSKIGIVGD